MKSSRGVPDDAIISIRSGAVRRQGMVSTDKPFRFPQSASESDCVVKVDILQNIGSGYLVMRPNQTEGKQFEVVLGGNSDMACELFVKPADGDRPIAAESQDDSAAAAKTKQDAKAYLESTGLLTFVQGVLQVVAKQQPQDPFAAMAKHFLIASDEASPAGPESPKKAPTTPKAVEETRPAEMAQAAEESAEAATESAKAAAEVPTKPESPKAEATAEATKPESVSAEAAAPEGEAKTLAEAAAPEGEAKAAQAAEQVAEPEGDKAEPENVDDRKSDALEEFTSTVKDATLPAGDEGGAKEAEAADNAESPAEAAAESSQQDMTAGATAGAPTPEASNEEATGAAAENAAKEDAAEPEAVAKEEAGEQGEAAQPEVTAAEATDNGGVDAAAEGAKEESGGPGEAARPEATEAAAPEAAEKKEEVAEEPKEGAE